jgi:hypothetical protein
MLAIAERDRARGALDPAQRARVATGAATLVENLADSESVLPVLVEDSAAAAELVVASTAVAANIHRPLLLCAGGRRDLDDSAALMLGQIAERAGAAVHLASAEELSSAGLARLPWDKIEMACLSYVDVAATAHSRFLVRRLRRRAPKVKLLVGFWTLDSRQRPDLLSAVRADGVATSLTEAMQQIALQMQLPTPATATPPQ